ncbi:MAG: indole-3-glycerol phosphate synthase TrpC [Phycisphaerales bacterium]|nr:indole-3-glycerol phosphate synthase TrpC [Phycisphaerales bacterium]
MPPTLEEIVQHKRREVAEAKESTSLEALRESVASASPARNFFGAVANGRGPGGINVIAEVKAMSPSAGKLRDPYDPAGIALQYENAGAVAISCLTDATFFGGSPEHLKQVRDAVNLPVLRKDFIIDPWQVWEARAMGADAILLIAEVLSEGQVLDMMILAHELNMTALVEVHEMESLLRMRRHIGFPHPGYGLLGINNRDLKTMTTDLNHTIRLLDLVEDQCDIIVSESGIKTREDLVRLARHGVRRVLIGESLLKEEDPGQALRELLDTPWS